MTSEDFTLPKILHILCSMSSPHTQLHTDSDSDDESNNSMSQQYVLDEKIFELRYDSRFPHHENPRKIADFAKRRTRSVNHGIEQADEVVREGR
jgi:hypothetical protein